MIDLGDFSVEECEALTSHVLPAALRCNLFAWARTPSTSAQPLLPPARAPPSADDGGNSDLGPFPPGPGAKLAAVSALLGARLADIAPAWESGHLGGAARLTAAEVMRLVEGVFEPSPKRAACL